MRHFSAKILLFGEYALLKGSPALALPHRRVGSYWTMKRAESYLAQGSRRSLQQLYAHVSEQKSLSIFFDLKAWQGDLAQGYWLASNIPSGYGLGSSGSVCAAVLARFGQQPPSDPNALRQLLAAMEGCWHGRSSGLDPLVAYLDQAVLLDASGQIEALLPQPPALPFSLYLWDSGQRRNTTPLVQHFLTMAEQISFQNEVLQPLIQANAGAIEALLAADPTNFWNCLRQISTLQLAHFQPMILPQQQAFWREGLATDEFLVKLCGAGGGGYALVFSKKELLGSDFMLWD